MTKTEINEIVLRIIKEELLYKRAIFNSKFEKINFVAWRYLTTTLNEEFKLNIEYGLIEEECNSINELVKYIDNKLNENIN